MKAFRFLGAILFIAASFIYYMTAIGLIKIEAIDESQTLIATPSQESQSQKQPPLEVKKPSIKPSIVLPPKQSAEEKTTHVPPLSDPLPDISRHSRPNAPSLSSNPPILPEIPSAFADNDDKHSRQLNQERSDSMLDSKQATANIPRSNKKFPRVIELNEAKARAKSGDAYAQAVLAIYYGVGYKVSGKDVQQAASYALESASQEHPLGLYRLATMMENGEGFRKDPAKAKQIKSIAIKGLVDMGDDPYALTALGVILFRGDGVVDQNRTKAVELYKRAADMGYAPAQYNYSAALAFGQGISRDNSESNRYWKKAFEQNYPPAMKGAPTEQAAPKNIPKTTHPNQSRNPYGQTNRREEDYSGYNPSRHVRDSSNDPVIHYKDLPNPQYPEEKTNNTDYQISYPNRW